MNKRDILLAALATGGKHEYTPVQIQKFLFLIEKNVAQRIGGPFFHFEPYDYGPFDASVYGEIRNLVHDGDASAYATSRGWKCHALTDQGVEKGEALFQQLPHEAQDYVNRAGEFVRSLSFTDLVSSIYKAYPEMKANSVFREGH